MYLCFSCNRNEQIAVFFWKWNCIFDGLSISVFSWDFLKLRKIQNKATCSEKRKKKLVYKPFESIFVCNCPKAFRQDCRCLWGGHSRNENRSFQGRTQAIFTPFTQCTTAQPTTGISYLPILIVWVCTSIFFAPLIDKGGLSWSTWQRWDWWWDWF